MFSQQSRIWFSFPNSIVLVVITNWRFNKSDDYTQLFVDECVSDLRSCSDEMSQDGNPLKKLSRRSAYPRLNSGATCGKIDAQAPAAAH